jgi:hypothetical protein
MAIYMVKSWNINLRKAKAKNIKAKKGKLLGRCPKTRKGQRQNPQKQKVVSAWGATPSGV